MKFFHLSDLHIGLKLFQHNLIEDQEYILKQIVQKTFQEKPDAVVIAGDIYDKAVPSAEAVAVFDHFISELTEAVPDAVIMMISGNHDSAPRVNVFRTVLSRQNIYMVGMPPLTQKEYIEKVSLRDSFGIVNFYLLPFVRPSMVRQIVGTREDGSSLSYHDTLHKLIQRERINPLERNVFVSHQFYLPAGADPDKIERMDSEVRTAGNIDEVGADLLERFDYAALGHIHKPMKVGTELFRYCGTPLACSISEAGQAKGIVVVEMQQKGDVKTTVLPLVPMRQVRVIKGFLEEVLQQGCSDYVTVILTDEKEIPDLDLQDRIQNEFPNLLEIRREAGKTADYQKTYAGQAELAPFALCSSFLGALDNMEQGLLADVVNTVQKMI